jgi:hypothetical protein
MMGLKKNPQIAQIAQIGSFRRIDIDKKRALVQRTI